jgi:hypothetical protein
MASEYMKTKTLSFHPVMATTAVAMTTSARICVQARPRSQRPLDSQAANPTEAAKVAATMA